MTKQKVIAVEEHYQIAQIRETFSGIDTYLLSKWEERLYDLGPLRIREMDEAGIDVQIISHINTQKLGERRSVELAKFANDTLQQAILRFPDRIAGYTELPLPNPTAAADELERTIVQCGFKGGMINGLTNNRFIDEPEFWPVLERANGCCGRPLVGSLLRNSGTAIAFRYRSGLYAILLLISRPDIGKAK